MNALVHTVLLWFLIFQIILATMDVTKSPSGHQIQLEEEELSDEERNKRETKRLNGIEVMRKLVQPCFVDIDQAFIEKRYNGH